MTRCSVTEAQGRPSLRQPSPMALQLLAARAWLLPARGGPIDAERPEVAYDRYLTLGRPPATTQNRDSRIVGILVDGDV